MMAVPWDWPRSFFMIMTLMARTLFSVKKSFRSSSATLDERPDASTLFEELGAEPPKLGGAVAGAPKPPREAGW